MATAAISNKGTSSTTKSVRKTNTVKKSKRSTKTSNNAVAATVSTAAAAAALPPQPSFVPQIMSPPTSSSSLPNMIDPNRVVSPQDQAQYKIKLLLHINNLLLARVINVMNLLAKHNNGDNNINNNNSNSNTNSNRGIVIPEHIQLLMSQNLKRVHANLQCISQMNQGFIRAKPAVVSVPELSLQNPQLPGGGDNTTTTNNNNINNNDILVKLYMVLARVIEFW